ncbi:hypothetical protein CBF23_009590 [Marinomonas agarivorans]|nr:hypothetical protein CBF23_009590 [Marinomonas agarivorans]
MQINNTLFFKTCRSSLFFVATIGTLTMAKTTWASDYSLGIEVGSHGVALGISGQSAISNNVQWRLSGGGISLSSASLDDSESEIDNVSYDEDFEFETDHFRAGYEWYPASSGWASNLFVSGGVAYLDENFSAKSDTTAQQLIGSITTTPGDGRQIEIDVDRSTILPYASLGWGNRLANGRGFSFRAEVGITQAVQDYDITVKSVGSTSISQADLDAEKRNIEEELEDSNSFISAGVSYVF